MIKIKFKKILQLEQSGFHFAEWQKHKKEGHTCLKNLATFY